jgi:GT2 family glycosyltransferase
MVNNQSNRHKMCQPKISIIIAVFNRLELTQACLASLTTSLKDFSYEVIIIDDCSTDGTQEYLRSLTHPFRVIVDGPKGNYSINNNLGASMAKGDTLCFLNNDTEVPIGWLQPMLVALKNYPDAGFIGNVQKIPSTNRFDHFGVCFPEWLTPIHYGQHLKKRPKLNGPYRRWAAVTAACVVIKKETFLAAGGFDESYINGCEDMDLCLRLHKQGHWHYVAHESEILHYKGASPGRKRFNDRNLEKFKETHREYLEKYVICTDAHIAAKSYLRSSIASPMQTNLPKLIKSIKTLLLTPEKEAPLRYNSLKD